MQTLSLVLVVSLLLNLILLRWAVSERSARREWQEEAILFKETLHNLHNGTGLRQRVGPALGLLILSGALLMMVLILLPRGG